MQTSGFSVFELLIVWLSTGPWINKQVECLLMCDATTEIDTGQARLRRGEKVADVSLGGSCVWDIGRDTCVIVVVRICCEGLLSSNSGLV